MYEDNYCITAQAREWLVNHNNDLAFSVSIQQKTISQHCSDTFTTTGELKVDKYVTLYYESKITYYDQTS